MIDDKFKPWLIEINTNPCLDTSSSVLRSMLPKIIDDSFKLSLDVFYPPPVHFSRFKFQFQLQIPHLF